MSAALILEFDGVGESEYDAVNGELGIDMRSGAGDWPDGLRSHAAGSADDGRMVVVEIWDSRDAQARFMESRLAAALQVGGVPEPSRVTWIDTFAYHTP